MALGGVGLVAYRLLELDLRGVVPADDHEIAAEDLVRFDVLQIELQRLRERANRFTDLLLREIGIAQCVPAPRRLRTVCHVFREERLDLCPSGLPDVAFQHRHAREVVPLGHAGSGRGRRWRRDRGWRAPRRAAISGARASCRACAAPLPIPVEAGSRGGTSTRLLRDRRNQRGPPIRDVEQRVLGAIAGGDEGAACLICAAPSSLRPALTSASPAGSSPRRLPARACRVLQRRDRFGRLPVLQRAPCRARGAPAGSREPSQSLSRGARLLPGPVSGTGPVGHCKVEEGLHRSGREPDRLLQLLDRRFDIGRVNAAPRFVRASRRPARDEPLHAARRSPRRLSRTE